MIFANAPFNPSVEPDGKGHRYVYRDQRIALAVNVALATHRPLLVTGSPGSGKSTLAADVAKRLHWAYVGTTITSRTRLEDLVGTVDLVRRLSDAQVRDRLREDEHYLVPGILWWAVDPGSAQERLGGRVHDPRQDAADAGEGVVLLLDEIDKAEPDLPNDLLGPLDGLRLSIPVVGERAPAHDRWLVVITSNGERAMPPAFLRRCVSLQLDDPDPAFLVSVARAHLGPRTDDLYAAVADHTVALAHGNRARNERPPSTAEYLDTVAVCSRFGERPGSALWHAIEEAALRKTRTPLPDAERESSDRG